MYTVWVLDERTSSTIILEVPVVLMGQYVPDSSPTRSFRTSRAEVSVLFPWLIEWDEQLTLEQCRCRTMRPITLRAISGVLLERSFHLAI